MGIKKLENYKKIFHFDSVGNTDSIKNINYFINSKLQNYLIYIMKNIIQNNNYTFYDMDSINNRMQLTVPKSKCHPDLYIKNSNNEIRYIEIKTIIGDNYKLTVDILQDTYDFIKKNYTVDFNDNQFYYVFLKSDTNQFDKNTIKNFVILSLDELKSNIKSRNFDNPGSYNNYTVLDENLFDSVYGNKGKRKDILDELNEYDFSRFKRDIEKSLFKDIN